MGSVAEHLAKHRAMCVRTETVTVRKDSDEGGAPHQFGASAPQPTIGNPNPGVSTAPINPGSGVPGPVGPAVPVGPAGKVVET